MTGHWNNGRPCRCTAATPEAMSTLAAAGAVAVEVGLIGVAVKALLGWRRWR